MNGPLRVIELFAGIGAQTSALERLGIDFTSTVCEIDPHAYNAYCAIHGPTPNLGDITKVEHLPECDLITYSFPCLTGETLVQTSEGWKRIDEIKKGDAIYTDDGYREVTDWAMTGIKPVMTVKAASGLPIRCTHYHPFLVRKKSRVWNNGRRSYDRVFSEPEWIEAHDLTKDCYLGFPIPQPKGIPDWDGIDLVWNDGRKSRHINELSELMSNPDFWYTVGRYLADGWIRTQGGIVIAFGKGKWEQSDRLPFNYSGVFERGSVMKAHIPLKELEAFCMQFGKGALNKHIPEEYKTIPKHLAEAMLNGYLDGDGSLSDKGYSITTVSRRLALDLAQLIAYVYERPSSIYHDRRKGTHTIEGRTVNQHDTYTVRFHKDARTQDKAFFENGWIWSPIQELTEISVLAKAEPVYDITVEGRHCFVAEGVLVKNCQDLSVAGNQKGMAEGSETRSALLWEVERLLQDMRERESAYRRYC